MKSIKIAGLCLVAMFVMSMAAAAMASAATWEQCTTEKTTVTKYTENECLTASSTGAWGWKEVTSTEKVETNGTLTLIDTGTLAGTSSVTCTGTDTGTIGPKQSGRTETITTRTCVPVKVCEAPVTAKAIGLPWQTELVEESSKKRLVTTSVSSKALGWSVTCKTVLGTKTDECTRASTNPEVTNKQAASSVQVTYNKSLAKATCTESKAATGEVEGAVQVFAAGYAVRVQ